MNRQLLALLVRNDLGSRFAGSAFGLLWVVALPLLQLGLFAFVFGVIFQARVPGLGEHGYLAFLALGMWPWLAFSEAVARGGAAICDSAALIGKVAIEPSLLVLARTLVAFVIHGAGFVLVVGVVVALEVPLALGNALWMVAGWLLLLPLAYACAMLAAICQVFFRDLQQLLPMLLAAVMYLSPILYSVQMLPEDWRTPIEASPLAGVLALIRDSLLFGRGPDLLGSAALGVAVVALPVWALHRRLRPHLEDYL